MIYNTCNANRTLDTGPVANQPNIIKMLTSPVLALVRCAIGVRNWQATRGFYLLKGRQSKTLQLVLAKARIKQPDYIIPGIWFDQRVRAEYGIVLPLRELKENNYYLHGCYLWFQPENSIGEVEIMYAGKASRLNNRLQQYWNDKTNSAFIQEWYEWAEAYNEPWTPCAAIWLCSDNDEFELKLIQSLKPRYNTAGRIPKSSPALKAIANDSTQQLRLFERKVGYII